jgi:asparagine synthase (glutamine-hydrolysing)
VPAALWQVWRRILERVPDNIIPARQRDRLSQLPDICRAPFGSHYYANQTYFTDQIKQDSVFDGRFTGLDETASYLQQLYEQAGSANPRDGVAYVDFQTQLPEEFLMMTDRFSMAHSLEARVPFLDHEFVEKILRIPASVRTQSQDLKYLLKKAVGDLLPEELLGAPKKGFVIPITLWLRSRLRPLAERLLSPDRLKQQGIFRPSFYASYVMPHLEGAEDFTWQVWAALMFQLWHVVFIEENAASAPNYGWEDLAA